VVDGLHRRVPHYGGQNRRSERKRKRKREI